MDEATYAKLADGTFSQIVRGLDALDAEDVDCDRAGDVLTITFKSGKRCVVNTQRPTRQIWLAFGTQAWHFSYDASQALWKDDKGRPGDLLTTLAGLVEGESGLAPKF
jgi:CyaY protein